MKRYFISTIDQLLLSAGAFATIMLLARWTEQEVVGQVAFLSNLCALFVILHKGVSNAFTVSAAANGKETECSQPIVSEFLSIHLPLIGASAVCLIILPFSFLSDRSEVILNVVLTVLLISTSLLYEGQRRTFWAVHHGSDALRISVLRLTVLFAMLFMFRSFDFTLTLPVVLGWMIVQRMVSLPHSVKTWLSCAHLRSRSIITVTIEYWRFSKWILLRDFLSYLAGNIYVPLVVLYMGFAKAGQYEVGRQLIAPFYILPMGLSSHLLPHLVQQRQVLSPRKYQEFIMRQGSIWMLGALVLSGLLIAFGKPIAGFLVSDAKKLGDVSESFWILAFFGCSITLNIFSEVVMFAMKRPDLGWRPMAVAACLNGLIGIPMVYYWGVAGAFGGNAITSAIAAILAVRAVMLNKNTELRQ